MSMLIFVSLALMNSAHVRMPVDTVDVRVVTDEADSVLALLRRLAPGTVPSRNALAGLVGTEGYRHLQERESAIGAPMSDSVFAGFLQSPGLTAHADGFQRALQQLARANLASASDLALAYLPEHSTLRARLYLEIKPRPNSFVFTGADSIPSIFLTVNPADSPHQVKNTMAHELHHIGVNAVCAGLSWAESSRVPPAMGMLLEYLTAFGEGRAMLAAAGGADVHPHAADPDSLRARWDQDVGRAPDDIVELSRFATDVLDERITSADSVRRRGNSYFGYQGPWYTVGWLMASSIEKELGRRALVSTLCDPVAFLASYNQAATQLNTRGASLPLWPTVLIARLQHASDIAAASRKQESGAN